MKKKIVFILLLLVGSFFVFDPFAWWPIDHLINKACTPEDMRPVCIGKIKFFWQ